MSIITTDYSGNYMSATKLLFAFTQEILRVEKATEEALHRMQFPPKIFFVLSLIFHKK